MANVIKGPDPVVNVNDVTRISKGASIKGEIVSVNDIRVDGKVDGKTYSAGRVVAGETAELSGSLYCNNFDLWGKFTGDIYVKDTLAIKEVAVVTGNVYARKLQVELGAQINGNCKMITEQEYDQHAAEVLNKKAPAAAAAPAAPAAAPAQKK